MKLGDIVYLKKANNLMGEIKAIDEMDRATLSLYVIRIWRLLYLCVSWERQVQNRLTGR